MCKNIGKAYKAKAKNKSRCYDPKQSITRRRLPAPGQGRLPVDFGPVEFLSWVPMHFWSRVTAFTEPGSWAASSFVGVLAHRPSLCSTAVHGPGRSSGSDMPPGALSGAETKVNHEGGSEAGGVERKRGSQNVVPL